MKYGFINLPTDTKNGCLILGIFNKKEISEDPLKFDIKNSQIIKKMSEELTEDYDSVWSFTDEHKIYIINCGNEEDYNAHKLNKIISILGNFIFTKKIKNIYLSLPQLKNYSPDWQVQSMILQFESLRYQMLDYKTKNKREHVLESIQFELAGASEKAIHSAEHIASGIKFTKDLANQPANICTPSYLSKAATKLEKEFKSINTKILDLKDIQKMGMGALIAVGQGSIETPKLIEIKYTGNKNQDPIVFVGKGITFDSGGISLKPSAGMEEMKFDMCGAASVLGVIKACALLQLPINVIGVLACAENMPSGSATKPGDVVKSLSGQTIEITNTDAEGRLVLADALTYVEQFKPQFVIDIATLTGAVIVALGNEFTGLITNDDNLADLILSAAKESQDKTWRLPLDDSYKDMLESPIADMVNSPPERVAGSSIGGTFLANFTKNYRWAHLDIAGSAWISGKNRKATGRPVYLLVQILRMIANAS